MPDNRGLYPRLTAREHVRYFGRLHGLGGDELEGRINHLIARLDMADFTDRRSEGYSKGQTLKALNGTANGSRNMTAAPGKVLDHNPYRC